jgi:hypothetical protein
LDTAVIGSFRKGEILHVSRETAAAARNMGANSAAPMLWFYSSAAARRNPLRNAPRFVYIVWRPRHGAWS